MPFRHTHTDSCTFSAPTSIYTFAQTACVTQSTHIHTQKDTVCMEHWVNCDSGSVLAFLYVCVCVCACVHACVRVFRVWVYY